MGSAVHLAARLEAQAPPGGLLISHDTFRHVRGVFVAQELELVRLKGFDEPINIYQILETKPRAFRVQSRGVEGIETRMVGREAEIIYLEDAYHMAIEGGEGQIITITGEAGIGKSRLLYEFQNWLELQPIDMRFFQGRASQETQYIPYSLIRDVFSFRYQIQDSDPLELVHQKIEAGFGEFIGMDDTGTIRSHIIGQFLGFDFDESPHLVGILENPKQLHDRASAYLTQYFQALCRHEPAVIFLEDIHWADDKSLELINIISQSISTQRLLIICLTRPQLFDHRPHWGEGLAYHQRIELQALNKRESRKLVGEILQKVEQAPVALRELVVSWAEGNPFFIEELIKMLIENKVIAKGPESWYVLPEELAQMSVPATLTGVLQARLDRLPEKERIVLDLAAVIGRTFWDKAVQYLQLASSPPGDADLELEIDEILSNLRERELIFRREEATFIDTHEYIFKHALLHEVAYENVTKRERRSHHKFTAEWLKKKADSTGRREEFATQIADHYLDANEDSSAADWFYLAGQRAMTQDAMSEARSNFTKALDLIPSDDIERRWGILLKRDEVLGILGDKDARLTEDENLVKIAEASEDANKVAEAFYRKGGYLQTLGQFNESVIACRKAVEAARRSGNRKLELKALSLVILDHKNLGEIDTALETADYILEMADEHLDDKTLAITLVNLATIYTNQDIQKAIQLFERSVEVCNRMGNHYYMARVLLNIGYSYTMAGHAEQGVKALKQALDLNETIGSLSSTVYNQLNLGLAYYRLGDLESALDILVEAASAIMDLEDPFADAACHVYSGLVVEQSQKPAKAKAHYEKAAQTYKRIGALGFAQDAIAGLARTELSMQNYKEAHQLASEVWDYLTQNGPKGMEFPILAYLTCARTFQAVQSEEQSNASIKGGHDELIKRANKFSGQDWRKTYLQAVPEHSAMLEMWKNK
jgi:tetratricopeptide (TPR) repeat protein